MAGAAKATLAKASAATVMAGTRSLFVVDPPAGVIACQDKCHGEGVYSTAPGEKFFAQATISAPPAVCRYNTVNSAPGSLCCADHACD
jgi:hypothetical protein